MVSLKSLADSRASSPHAPAASEHSPEHFHSSLSCLLLVNEVGQRQEPLTLDLPSFQALKCFQLFPPCLSAHLQAPNSKAVSEGREVIRRPEGQGMVDDKCLCLYLAVWFLGVRNEQ